MLPLDIIRIYIENSNNIEQQFCIYTYTTHSKTSPNPNKDKTETCPI